MSHSNQPFDSFKEVSKQEILSPQNSLKVKTEEAQIGKAGFFKPSLHFHPNVKVEMFAYDDVDMDDVLNNMDPYLYKESMHQPFNSSLDIDQETDVKPMPSQCASRVQKSHGTVKTDKGAYSGPTGMDDDKPIPKAQDGLSSGTTEMDDDEPYWPLSGKPYFHMIFTKTQATHPYMLGLPSKITRELPSASVPAVITYCGKRWEMVYLGDLKHKRFNSSWAKFAIDNKLKVGDGCFFELTENSPTRVKFRAQILRCPDLPDRFGSTSEAPIFIE